MIQGSVALLMLGIADLDVVDIVIGVVLVLLLLLLLCLFLVGGLVLLFLLLWLRFLLLLLFLWLWLWLRLWLLLNLGLYWWLRLFLCLFLLLLLHQLLSETLLDCCHLLSLVWFLLLLFIDSCLLSLGCFLWWHLWELLINFHLLLHLILDGCLNVNDLLVSLNLFIGKLLLLLQLLASPWFLVILVLLRPLNFAFLFWWSCLF